MFKILKGIACCPCSHGLRPKKLSVNVAVPPAPARVPSQRPLPRVSRQSHRTKGKACHFAVNHEH